jgi:hypothetical protein
MHTRQCPTVRYFDTEAVSGTSARLTRRQWTLGFCRRVIGICFAGAGAPATLRSAWDL